ncbi:hypothetical protein MICAF_3430006 [Microcystis aeruginosa PCC 9807]|uniref:Uncharacterized protein n=1 Tax=Microcystis aeruginosa PCC 9807 TaxID=1160283 RepID=I4H7I3_MICAE|nr:hypothetical protein MICAF_3430006 [Microcystis aeruginosa PCC 9807]
MSLQTHYLRGSNYILYANFMYNTLQSNDMGQLSPYHPI